MQQLYIASIEVTPLRLGNAFIHVKYGNMHLDLAQPLTLIGNMWNHISKESGVFIGPILERDVLRNFLHLHKERTTLVINRQFDEGCNGIAAFHFRFGPGLWVTFCVEKQGEVRMYLPILTFPNIHYWPVLFYLHINHSQS